MPTQSEHVAQAQHNRSFWTSFELNSTQFLDWVVTGMFYEGVHWVEAFLSSRGEHSYDHKQRLLAMTRSKKEIGTVIKDLEILKVESENARYRCHQYTSSEISNDLIPLAERIKAHVQSNLPPSSVP